MAIYILIVVVQGLIFGGFSAFIAKEKKRDEVIWFILGFFFSILALLALIAIPERIDAKVQNNYFKSDVALCPYCRENIKPDAIICKHCKSDLSLNKAIILEERSPISSDDTIVDVINKSMKKPPPYSEVTAKPIKVRKINPKNGNILFEIEFRRGIKYGIVDWKKLENDILIYSEGNYFLASKKFFE